MCSRNRRKTLMSNHMSMLARVYCNHHLYFQFKQNWWFFKLTIFLLSLIVHWQSYMFGVALPGMWLLTSTMVVRTAPVSDGASKICDYTLVGCSTKLTHVSLCWPPKLVGPQKGNPSERCNCMIFLGACFYKWMDNVFLYKSPPPLNLPAIFVATVQPCLLPLYGDISHGTKPEYCPFMAFNSMTQTRGHAGGHCCMLWCQTTWHKVLWHQIITSLFAQCRHFNNISLNKIKHTLIPFVTSIISLRTFKTGQSLPNLCWPIIYVSSLFIGFVK